MSSIKQSTQKCTAKNCNMHNFARGYCSKHYYRKFVIGDLYAPTKFDKRDAIIVGDIAKIPLGVGAKDGYAIVDKNFAYLDKYQWQKSNHGYAVRGENGKRIMMHYHILEKKNENNDTDHINRNKLDNRKCNLREVSRSGNVINTYLRKDNTTGYKNIYYDKSRNRWRVSITRNNKTITHRMFANINDAIKFRDEVIKQWES